jgi:predicted DNA-binding transcriptional regulator AlpA
LDPPLETTVRVWPWPRRKIVERREQGLDVMQALATSAGDAPIEAPMSLREAERRRRQRDGSAKKKAALSPELIAANLEDRTKVGLADELPRRKHENECVHRARAPPLERLLSKHDVVAITSLSFPTIWAWMRAGKFPRSRIVGGKSMWLASEVNAWLAGLPVRPLKGDAAEVAAGGA